MMLSNRTVATVITAAQKNNFLHAPIKILRVRSSKISLYIKKRPYEALFVVKLLDSVNVCGVGALGAFTNLKRYLVAFFQFIILNVLQLV